MLYELMALMLAAPETGDRFQGGKLAMIAAAALCLAIAAGVIARVKGDKDDDDNDNDKE